MNRMIPIATLRKTDQRAPLTPMVVSGTHGLDMCLWLMEGKNPPRHRHAPGRHVHAVNDQSWFVIAGRGRWFIGDQTIEARPGDFVHGPHAVPHAFSADTDDLHVLVITAPAGLEGFFAAMGVDATDPTHPPAELPESPEDPDLARRYGITALGPELRWTWLVDHEAGNPIAP